MYRTVILDAMLVGEYYVYVMSEWGVMLTELFTVILWSLRTSQKRTIKLSVWKHTQISNVNAVFIQQ